MWLVVDMWLAGVVLSCAAALITADGAQSWWQSAIVYQIYPLSFYDDVGEGFGNLKGYPCK